jgi:hypothetical protein
MARKFNQYKYLYSTDLNREVIRTQREYKNPDGTVIIPITQLFLDRVINSSNSKNVIEKLDDKQRRLEVEVILNNTASKFKQYIPYAPNDENLKQHILEIKDSVKNKYSVYCGDYFGENSVNLNVNN